MHWTHTATKDWASLHLASMECGQVDSNRVKKGSFCVLPLTGTPLLFECIQRHRIERISDRPRWFAILFCNPIHHLRIDPCFCGVFQCSVKFY
jgi:hypothetical protein